MACVEMMQCISQGLSINARKGSTKGGDVAAPLLQLPHMDQDALKKLRKQKVNALKGRVLRNPESSQLVVCRRQSCTWYARSTSGLQCWTCSGLEQAYVVTVMPKSGFHKPLQKWVIYDPMAD